MEQKPSYYSILTAEVRYHPNLSPFDKLLYSDITSLTNKKGYCNATNKYFSKVFNKSISTISRAIATLSDNGFVHTKLIKDDNNEIVERKIFLKETTPIPMGKNAHTPISKNDYRGIGKNAQYNNTSKNNTSINIEKINKKEKLIIPTIEKIDEHMNQYIVGKGLQVNTMSDAESFFMYYESNGWYVGKNKMKCWKSAATGWVARKYIQKNAYSYNVKQEPKKEKEINQLREIYDRI